MSEYFIRLTLTLMALFLIGSMVGYLLEVLFRRFFTVRKWVNPGFMKGPWLPMYGFGVIFMFLFCLLFYKFMPQEIAIYNPQGNLFERGLLSAPTIYDLIPIFSLTLIMIVLEFVAGIIFVKGFKVRLWDYSNMKGNIQGVICPLFNFIWFVVAIIYYYGINPFVYSGFNLLYAFFFGSDGQIAHFGTVFFLGLVYGIFLLDLIGSIDLFAKVRELAKSSGMIERYEKIREEVRLSQEGAKRKFFDLLPSVIKKNTQGEKNKTKVTDKIIEEARKAVLIDPDKKSTEQNYDEKGRPRKEE